MEGRNEDYTSAVQFCVTKPVSTERIICKLWIAKANCPKSGIAKSGSFLRQLSFEQFLAVMDHFQQLLKELIFPLLFGRHWKEQKNPNKTNPKSNIHTHIYFCTELCLFYDHFPLKQRVACPHSRDRKVRNNQHESNDGFFLPCVVIWAEECETNLLSISGVHLQPGSLACLSPIQLLLFFCHTSQVLRWSSWQNAPGGS